MTIRSSRWEISKFVVMIKSWKWRKTRSLWCRSRSCCWIAARTNFTWVWHFVMVSTSEAYANAFRVVSCIMCRTRRYCTGIRRTSYIAWGKPLFSFIQVITIFNVVATWTYLTSFMFILDLKPILFRHYSKSHTFWLFNCISARIRCHIAFNSIIWTFCKTQCVITFRLGHTISTRPWASLYVLNFPMIFDKGWLFSTYPSKGQVRNVFSTFYRRFVSTTCF